MECEEFLARVRGIPGSTSDGWAGAAVVATLVAADRSIEEEGRLVDVPGLR
jgi:hypothetical protein